jgi:hypothetical protein
MGIPGRPALVFCQQFTRTLDDHARPLFNSAGPRGRTAVTGLNVDDVRCEALFASGLQRSDRPSAACVAEAISACVRRFGARGWAGRMAQEFQRRTNVMTTSASTPAVNQDDQQMCPSSEQERK